MNNSHITHPDADLTERICKPIRETGMPAVRAARLAGFSPGQWEAICKPGLPIHDAVELAEAEWMYDALKHTQSAQYHGGGGVNRTLWRWLLERRFPDEWGKTRSSAPKPPPDPPPSPPPRVPEPIALALDPGPDDPGSYEPTSFEWNCAPLGTVTSGAENSGDDDPAATAHASPPARAG